MNRPEELLQKAVVTYIELAYPKLVFFAVPNQRGTRKKWEMGLLKAMGVRAGVPDICIVLPNGSVAFIELKAGKTPLNDNQKLFRDALPEGARWALCRSIDDVAAVLKEWIKAAR